VFFSPYFLLPALLRREGFGGHLAARFDPPQWISKHLEAFLLKSIG